MKSPLRTYELVNMFAEGFFMWRKNYIILGILVLALIVYRYGTSLFDDVSHVLSSKLSTQIEEMEIENQTYTETGEAELFTEAEEAESFTEAESGEVQVILDPGHGGDDPGMVGINQALEKDINLEVALKVYDLLVESGYSVLMTREDENGMDPTGEMSKVEDLDARVELMNETSPELVVSIHQNSYSSESIHGAQVFYYTNSEEGAVAAQILQDALLAVDPDNTRQIEANDTYYLLKKTEVPTIIVECGFLSNASEADKLIDEEYQQGLAEAIASGIIEYLGGTVL